MHHGDRSILQKAGSLKRLLSSESLGTKRRKLLPLKYLSWTVSYPKNSQFFLKNLRSQFNICLQDTK